MASRQPWAVRRELILELEEIERITADQRSKARRSPTTLCNLAVFRLSSCCGLRASEICGLLMADVRSELRRPYIEVRAEVAKLKRRRTVPLHWDADTLQDLRAWADYRRRMMGAGPDAPYIASTFGAAKGRPLTRQQIRRRFRLACKCLPARRREQLTTHSGRHTFVSLALAGGRSLPEVQAAAGHTRATMTDHYTHVARELAGDELGRLFSRTPE